MHLARFARALDAVFGQEAVAAEWLAALEGDRVAWQWLLRRGLVAFARGEPRSRFFVTDDQGEATTAEPPQADCGASQGKAAVKIDLAERAERSAAVERLADEQATKLAALLLAREREFTEEVAVVWAGFARFCREQLGVEPDGLIKSASAAPGGANPGPLAEYPDLAAPDGARVEAYFGRLCATFRGGEGRA